MNTEFHTTLSRRDALLRAVTVSLGLVAVPALARQAGTSVAKPAEPEFVPVDDYPFFGYGPIVE